MDTKRMILFIVLATVVLLAYQYFFVKPAVKPGQKPVATSAPVTTPVEKRVPAATGKLSIDSLLGAEKKDTAVQANLPHQNVTADVAAGSQSDVRMDTPLYTATFTNRGAGLKSFVLKRYKDDKQGPLDLVSRKADGSDLYPFYLFPLAGDQSLAFLNKQLYQVSREGAAALRAPGDSGRIIFEFANRERNLSLRKVFTFRGNSYVIETSWELWKDGVQLLDVPVVFGPELENNISSERKMLANLKIATFNGDSLQSTEFVRVKTQATAGQDVEMAQGDVGSGFFWGAYETTYFAAMFRADRMRGRYGYLVLKRIVDRNKNVAELYSYLIVTTPNLVYLGPKDEEVLATVESSFPGANRVIEYGWFGAIAKIMLRGILLIHRYVPNYGWAILLFTLLLKIVFFPLTYSSSVSMAKMQALQPKVKAIKKKFKNQRDPEQRRQMNVELMSLYKGEKVNPAGGCLPLLIQLPILWGFFRLLSVSINVRHEPWMLWISDLSKKDPIYLLPILMGVTQILLQMMTPTGGDDTQKKMMYIMPVVMVILFASFPSGLNLYWTFSNVLQMGQQKIINDNMFKKRKDEEHERKILKRKKGAKYNG